MIDSKMSEMLTLYKDTLDVLKLNEFRDKDRLVEYYDNFYKIAKTHKPVINEAWNEHGVTRHGWKGIKGTVSEMLTTYYCAKVHRWRVFPISNQQDQEYGSDLLIEKGAEQAKISVKSVKAWTPPNSTDTRLNLDKDFFAPGLFRITFISLVDPIKKQLWFMNYEALASEYCTITPNNLCIPKFETYTYMFVNEFQKKYPNTFNYENLNQI
ncbi:MAG: hypothetical protein KGI25_07745 [Thaumarchaeota archaeon]|nr:hypothetical protein [Nitrososphaerota archaeon]